MAITETALDERLSRADRGTRIAADREALAGLAARTRAEAHRRSIRSRIVGGAGAAVLVVGLAFAAPAAADGLRWLVTASPAAQQMDAFIHGNGGTEIIPGSAVVDTSQADLRDYVDHDYEAWLPLAPGQTRAQLVDAVTASAAANPGLRQEVGLRRDLERLVYIGWLDEWLDAHAAGDPARQSAAVAVLRAAADWPAFVATDGGGLTGAMRVLAERIAAGDADAAEFLLELEGAPSWDGVDRPQFGPILDQQVRLDCQARPELGCLPAGAGS